ncbi:hypothetical protein [Amycolatopsis sp. NPDC001319]|uniref:hypothetical protein n=1 Tax=Amycolatopsis sp. NPDC001319 TaxID=3363922 RepID=UPI0036CE1D5A
MPTGWSVERPTAASTRGASKRTPGAPLPALAPATLEAIRTDQCEDGYVYRFAPDDRPLGEAEGAFLLRESSWRWLPQGFVHALLLEIAPGRRVTDRRDGAARAPAVVEGFPGEP